MNRVISKLGARSCRSRGQGIVDGAAAGEVTVALRQRGNKGSQRLGRVVLNALIGHHEEGFIAAIIEVRDDHGAIDHTARLVELIVRSREPGSRTLIQVRVEVGVLKYVVRRPVVPILAVAQDGVNQESIRVAVLRVVECRLCFNLLYSFR